MSKPKVFITRKIPDSGIKLLKKSCQVKIQPKDRTIKRSELEKGVKWCDALLPLLTDKIDGKLMDLNKNLKVIANYAVGFDNIDLKAATARNIPVTNTPGVLTDAVAEHAIALLISIARRVPESDRYSKAGKYKGWAPMLFLGAQLKGKTLGIVGSGRIGSAVAERAVGLGMNIIYRDIKRNPLFEKATKGKFTTLDNVMKKSDFISVHTPLFPSTRHLIGKKQFNQMKKTAYIINTSRGPVLDEKALVQALKQKKIAGAAVDVLEWEPKLSAGMNKLDNLIVTPHTASATIETRSAMSELAAKNILAALKGKVPPNLVNKDVKL